MQGEGGTPLLPDLGKHCMVKSCNLLDFLPFKCDACKKVFCAKHRSCKQHDCPQANTNDRVVVICPACSVAVIKPFNGDPSLALQKHAESGECDPAKRPRERPTCSASRCRQILTFSNTYLCKSCRRETCLKHRFPSDHGCSSGNAQKNALQECKDGSAGVKFLSALAKRQGKECASSEGGARSGAGSSAEVGKPAASPVVKAR